MADRAAASSSSARARALAGLLLGLAITGVGLCGSAHAAEPAPKGCKLAQVAELPVRFEHNRPLIKVEINGREAWLLADTGAFKTVLFGRAVTRFGLNPKQVDHIEVYGVGGAAVPQTVTLASLKLGRASLTRPTLLVLADVGEPDDEEVGVLGRDLFGQRDIELDLKGSIIRLLDSSNCRQADLAYWAKEYSIAPLRRSGEDGYVVEASLNGRPVQALIDSGAPVSYVTARAATVAGVRVSLEGSDELTGGIGSRAVQVRTATFSKLDVGGEVVSNVKLKVGDLYTGTESVALGSLIARRPDDLPDLILGADFLQAHHVLLSTTQRRMYLTYNGGPIFQVRSPGPERKQGANAKTQ